MQKQLILYVLNNTVLLLEILTSFLPHLLIELGVFFLDSLSALECITVGDGPPWKNARIHAVK